MSPKIAKIVVGLPVDGPFDYAIGEEQQKNISLGRRVRVSFNRRNHVGFVVGTGMRSAFKRLNPILTVLDNSPVLDSRGMALAKMFSAYYGCSLGEAIETFLPAALRGDKLMYHTAGVSATVSKKPAGMKGVTLVHDQTRQKRWPLVIEIIEKVSSQGKGVIVLVPEISHIAQKVALLTKAMSIPVFAFERKMTPKSELEHWEKIKNGNISIIVGTRSAVFAPFPRLGLIVMDEEDHPAYKQEQAPAYHVGHVAQMRLKVEECRVIMMSSAPSAEVWEKARKDKWEKITIPSECPAKIQIIDMNNYNPGKTSILSFPLQNAIRKTLEQKGRVLLYMNRRGFSTKTHCQQCGLTLKCARCDVNLTYLFSKKVMVCRHCNFRRELPKICPQCKGGYLRSTGTGVEKLESETARLFPYARIQHYDRDSRACDEQADIIIATQAIFRLQGQWSAALVAMLNFDAQVYHIDFRSGHKAFSLLVHLRQLACEKFLIQTRMPESYCIRAVKDMNFNQFYKEELKLRKELNLPPYCHLVALTLRGKQEEVVFDQSKVLFTLLSKNGSNNIEITDPHPDVSPKRRDQFRFTIILKGKSVRGILALIKSTLKGFRKKNIVVTVNVDP